MGLKQTSNPKHLLHFNQKVDIPNRSKNWSTTNETCFYLTIQNKPVFVWKVQIAKPTFL